MLISLLCPTDCKSTKATFNGLNVANVGVMELDNEAEGDVIQGYLAEKTGQRTVPNVFIDGKHIGGNSEVQSLLSKGQLQKLVSA